MLRALADQGLNHGAGRLRQRQVGQHLIQGNHKVAHGVHQGAVQVDDGGVEQGWVKIMGLKRVHDSGGELAASPIKPTCKPSSPS